MKFGLFARLNLSKPGGGSCFELVAEVQPLVFELGCCDQHGFDDAGLTDFLFVELIATGDGLGVDLLQVSCHVLDGFWCLKKPCGLRRSPIYRDWIDQTLCVVPGIGYPVSAFPPL